MKASILILISELHSVTDNFFKMLSNYTKLFYKAIKSYRGGNLISTYMQNQKKVHRNLRLLCIYLY